LWWVAEISHQPTGPRTRPCGRSSQPLWFITAATVKLFPRPVEVATVFAGLPSLQAAASLFSSASQKAGPLLTAFELVPRILLDFLLMHMPQNRDPFSGTRSDR